MDDSHTPLKNPLISTPTSGKETEPAPHQPQEMMEPIRAPEIGPEVSAYIEQRDKMTVPPDLKSMGVRAADNVHGSTGPAFPISDEKIEEGLHQPVNSSWRWLSETLVYHLKQLHLTIKKVHGHIVRVARG
ncbi:MAG: hypothetical protein WAT72_02335 [Microgenomates group bacterium]|jgi:hypothetical protein|nr:hypothetical protein [Candidatus Woesebacteria bacterium]MBP6883032.1 hypothetical protein [Candidatus Woesebacteria bacterium]QQR63890.1 MAG: hypothetical protein IPH70_05335 [Candidatus Roizmanbacteria bacterium]